MAYIFVGACTFVHLFWTKLMESRKNVILEGADRGLDLVSFFKKVAYLLFSSSFVLVSSFLASFSACGVRVSFQLVKLPRGSSFHPQ